MGNALFSSSCGLLLLGAASTLGPVFGVPPMALRIVGLTLLPFAVALVLNARRTRPNRSEAKLAVALDLGWVVASLVLLIAGLWPLSAAGFWAVLGVADCVLAFALLQAWGLHRWRAA